VYLTHIVNACFKYSHFPTAWKQANVIPILKPGKDPSDPKSSRPISLLNALIKILGRLLLQRLKSHVADHRIYLNKQFGSRKKHSTSHQLLRVTKHIASGLAAKLSTGMLLLNYQKAFDCVWLHKLLEYRFFMVYIKLIWSFLTDRVCYCCWIEVCRMWGSFWSATVCSSLSDTLQYIYF
jgi:hypothetical protein